MCFCVRVTGKVLVVGSGESNKSNKGRFHRRELFLTSEVRVKKDKRLEMVRVFLESGNRLEGMRDKGWKGFVKYASVFFVKEGQIWQ